MNKINQLMYIYRENDKIWPKGKILEFMSIIDECLSSTTYAVDRNIYSNDLAAAARWLLKLYRGEPLTQICKNILSNQTNKILEII